MHCRVLSGSLLQWYVKLECLSRLAFPCQHGMSVNPKVCGGGSLSRCRSTLRAFFLCQEPGMWSTKASTLDFKLIVTSASLLVTSALLGVTMFAIRNSTLHLRPSHAPSVPLPVHLPTSPRRLRSLRLSPRLCAVRRCGVRGVGVETHGTRGCPSAGGRPTNGKGGGSFIIIHMLFSFSSSFTRSYLNRPVGACL